MARFISNQALAESVATTVTSGSTVTLTTNSATIQQFTGGTAQTVKLPVGTTLEVGMRYVIANRSTELITVNYSDDSLATTIGANSQAEFRVMAITTAVGTWDISESAAGAVTLVNGGIEELTDTTETSYTVESGKVHLHFFMHVLTGHTLTVDSGARLVSTEDTIDGTVVVNPGGIWKVV